MTDLTTAKVITYNRETRDFDASFDGNYIGSFRTMHEAENELNQHVLRLCEDGLIDQPLAALAEQALVAANPDLPTDDDDDTSDIEVQYDNIPYPNGIGNPEAPDAPDAGAAVARQFHRDRARFLTVLRNLDRDAWQLLAAAYCAYMSRTGTWITPEHILRVWGKAVEADITLPARVHPIVAAADASAESYAGIVKPQC